MKSKRKKLVLLIVSFSIIFLIFFGIYQFNSNSTNSNLNSELNELKSKKEIVDYSIKSKQKNIFQRDYIVTVKHTSKNKNKYPREMIIRKNMFDLKPSNFKIELEHS